MNANDYELFRIQAIKAAGLEGHPQANGLYEMAWKSGWEGGKDEVLEHLCDLADLVLNIGIWNPKPWEKK